MPTPDQFVTICLGLLLLMLGWAAITYARRS
jgi:hypothetical protein